MPDQVKTSTSLESGAVFEPTSEVLIRAQLDEREASENSAVKLRLLWQNRRFLFQTAVCGLVAAMLVAFLIPKRYESRAQLAPPDSSSLSPAVMLGSLAGNMGGLTALAENALGLKSSTGLFVAILKSETVQDRLIQKFELQKLYRARYIEDARKELSRHTAVSDDRESGVVTITVTDYDPRRAAAMAQEYVNELNRVVNQVSTSSARRERIFLEERLEQVNQELEKAEKEFSQFASQKAAIDIPTQGKAMVEAGATLQGQLIAAQSELEGLRQIYTSNNVRVRSLQARIYELRRALEKIGGKGATETGSVEQLYPSMRQLPLLGVQYADLFRRVKVEEAVFQTLTQEYELAKVGEAREIPTVKVLDPPLVPQKKSFPPRLLIMLLGTLLAFVFASIWVLGRAAWEASDPTDPHKVLAVEVWRGVRETLPWAAQNGSQWRWPAKWPNNGYPGSNGDDTNDRKQEG